MKRFGAIVMLAGLLAGCGSIIKTTEKDVAAPQMYRPQGVKTQWEITGYLESDYLKNTASGYEQVQGRTLHVRINGEEVLSGELSKKAEGEVEGHYGGLPLRTVCTSEVKTVTWMEVRCVVYIGGERTVTLVM